MAVYVDNFYVTGVMFRGMKMSHLIADSRDELLEMADNLGLRREWIQDYDTTREHFDVSYTKRELAIELGAISIPFRELALKTSTRTYEGNTPDY